MRPWHGRGGVGGRKKRGHFGYIYYIISKNQDDIIIMSSVSSGKEPQNCIVFQQRHKNYNPGANATFYHFPVANFA